MLADNGFVVERLIDEPRCYCCEAVKKFQAPFQAGKKSELT